MAIRYDAVLALPIITEEQLQMPRSSIQDFIGKQQNQVAQLLLQAFILPYSIQVGVWLQDMKMRIHGLALILVFIAKAHIGKLAPVAGKGFAIAIQLGVEALA